MQEHLVKWAFFQGVDSHSREGEDKLSHRTLLIGELRAGFPVWDSLSTPSVWWGNSDKSLRLISKDIKEGKELSKLAFRRGRKDPSLLVVGNRDVWIHCHREQAAVGLCSQQCLWLPSSYTGSSTSWFQPTKRFIYLQLQRITLSWALKLYPRQNLYL